MLTLIILMSCFQFHNAIVNINKNYAKNNFEPQTYYAESNTASIKTTQSFNHQRNSETHSTNSHSIYAIVNDNNVDVAHNVYHNSEGVSGLPFSKPLQSQKLELLKGNIKYVLGSHQLVLQPGETNPMSSNDRKKAQYLAANITPSPSNLEMHPHLHHHTPLTIYKPPTVMSHTAVNEASTMTTESVKPLTPIKHLHYVSTRGNDENLIANNKFNYYDKDDSREASTLNAHFPEASSKQYLYAPVRSALEKELPHASNLLPYPPSFIYITTTEAPVLNYNKVPDLFTYRHYKSLWDSYIPSWQITKMLQQFNNKIEKKHLQTLAYTKQNRVKIEK